MILLFQFLPLSDLNNSRSPGVCPTHQGLGQGPGDTGGSCTEHSWYRAASRKWEVPTDSRYNLKIKDNQQAFLGIR